MSSDLTINSTGVFGELDLAKLLERGEPKEFQKTLYFSPLPKTDLKRVLITSR